MDCSKAKRKYEYKISRYGRRINKLYSSVLYWKQKILLRSLDLYGVYRFTPHKREKKHHTQPKPHRTRDFKESLRHNDISVLFYYRLRFGFREFMTVSAQTHLGHYRCLQALINQKLTHLLIVMVTQRCKTVWFLGGGGKTSVILEFLLLILTF